MKLRIIKTVNTNPYENLAAEEFLTFGAAEGEVTFFLWQNAHTVVIGRNQNPWRECNVERIKADGAYLARRMSGGGAVYHDMGNLNFTFIARDDLFDIAKQTDVILLACRLLGIKAEKTGRNDLTVDGKKFSGHAYYSSNGYNYHHGTVMMKVNPEDMPRYLNVPESKLKSKGVSSVKSRVTNLAEYLDDYKDREKLTEKANTKLISMMQDALIRAAIREYKCSDEDVVYEELPETPVDLVEKYSSEEWRLGTRIPFEKSVEHRFSWGGVEVQLAMRGEYIEQVKIYSDSLETETFAVIEDLLKGCKYDAGEILGLKLPKGTSATAYEVLELVAKSIN